MNYLFRDHPSEMGETYFQHMREAIWTGTSMIAAGLAALIHGFVPGVFQTTASDLARRVAKRVDDRSSQAKKAA